MPGGVTAAGYTTAGSLRSNRLIPSAKFLDFKLNKLNHGAPMKTCFLLLLCVLFVCPLGSLAAPVVDSSNPKKEEAAELQACAQMVLSGFRKIADIRNQRFEGKVTEATALCRGGQKTLQFRLTPWVDWSQYWGTGDMSSLPSGFISTKGPAFRGVTGALLDLEYERIELIKFNLFDNNGTYQTYVTGRAGVGGAAIKTWPEMRLPKDSKYYLADRRRWGAGVHGRSDSRPHLDGNLQ